MSWAVPYKLKFKSGQKFLEFAFNEFREYNDATSTCVFRNLKK